MSIWSQIFNLTKSEEVSEGNFYSQKNSFTKSSLFDECLLLKPNTEFILRYKTGEQYSLLYTKLAFCMLDPNARLKNGFWDYKLSEDLPSLKLSLNSDTQIILDNSSLEGFELVGEKRVDVSEMLLEAITAKLNFHHKLLLEKEVVYNELIGVVAPVIEKRPGGNI